MSNPKLAVEFAALGEKSVLASIDRVTGAGQSYLDKWVEHTKSATVRNEASYTSFWNKIIALEDRKTREMFQMSRTRLAEEERIAKQRERAEAAASREIVRQKKAETAELIAEGKRVLQAQEAQARESARIAKQTRAQLNLENRVVNAGGYGPNLPTASAPTTSGAASALNTGLVNAAAFLNVATSAYYMASKAVAVVSSFVLDAAKWEAMTLALENMEGGAANAAGAIARLYEIAKAPGIDLETAQHAYLKLRAVSIQGSEAERIIKAFSNTVARGGGGSVQLGRVIEQFTQMRAENRVLQQDLKFMKNSMPELASLMQKAFGTTTAEGIRKLGLNAKQFTEGILAEMEKLPKAQQTLTSEIENTGVAWSRLKAAFVDTDYVKSKLQSLTKTLEALRTAIAGNEQEKARAEINAKYDNQISSLAKVNQSPARWLMYKIRGGSALNDEAYRGQLAGQLEKQRRAELALLDKAYEKPKTLDEVLGEFDPNNPFKVRGAKEKVSSKKKSESSGSGETDLGWNDPKRVAAAKKYARDLEKIERERRERSAKEFREAREEEEKANKDHQNKVTAWNQAKIDENRKRNQEANAFEGSKNPLVQAELAYWSEAERITELFANEEDKRTKYLEQANQDRLASIRQFYADQYSIALTGSADMFMALAELRKNGTSEANDAYQVLFGISKAFAIADATVKLASAAISAMSDPDSITTAQKFANMGSVMAAGAGLISQINATAYSGVFDKGGNIPAGGWGIAGENGPEIIQGPAHVTSTRDTARLIGNSGGTKVVVNNYAGVAVSTKSNSNGEIEVLIQRAAEAAEDRIAGGIASGGGKVARQMTRTFGVKR